MNIHLLEVPKTRQLFLQGHMILDDGDQWLRSAFGGVLLSLKSGLSLKVTVQIGIFECTDILGQEPIICERSEPT